MATATPPTPARRARHTKKKLDPTTLWHSPHQTRASRPGHGPRPRTVHLLELLCGLGLGAVVALGLSVEGHAALASAGGWPLAISRVAAFAGSYLLLVMVVLAARLPWLERTVGQDVLVRWHRKVAPYTVSLVSLHVLSVILGYAQMLRSNVFHMLWSFWVNYPDMLMATVGYGLLLMAAFTSIRIARSRMKYETWWVVHLYTYLGLTLSFMHQIRTGVMFVGHEHTIQFWTSLWVGLGLLIAASRVIPPLVRNQRHQLRVALVHEEAPGVHSLTISGKNLESLAVAGGQFFQWRFMSKGLWSHSHPYSISALPRPPYLRVTVKALGDQSRALAQVKPGTRVLVEGPYGAFTHHALATRSATLVAAGVGVTPIRALLEDLPGDVDVTVIVRAGGPEHLVHAEEIKSLVAAREGSYYEVLGHRDEATLDDATLSALAPDLAHGDLFVCGPDGFTDLVIGAAQRLGVARERIHYEAFTF